MADKLQTKQTSWQKEKLTTCYNFQTGSVLMVYNTHVMWRRTLLACETLGLGIMENQSNNGLAWYNIVMITVESQEFSAKIIHLNMCTSRYIKPGRHSNDSCISHFESGSNKQRVLKERITWRVQITIEFYYIVCTLNVNLGAETEDPIRSCQTENMTRGIPLMVS